jgi:hypothetical protein
MHEIRKRLHEQDVESFVLPYLRGRLFHFATYANYQGILRSGAIEPNRDCRRTGRFANPNSYGFRNGLISIFDFRAADDTEIAMTRERYDFLRYDDSFKCVHLLLHEDHLLPDLIPNKVAMESGAWCIPRTECWYPHDIPVQCVTTALVSVVVEVSETTRLFLAVEGRPGPRGDSDD